MSLYTIGVSWTVDVLAVQTVCITAQVLVSYPDGKMGGWGGGGTRLHRYLARHNGGHINTGNVLQHNTAISV